MQFANLVDRANEIRKRYEAWEQERYGRSWTAEEIMLGFVGDVGDLAKLVLAKEGVHAIPDVDDKLAHELGDCLWSLLVLARIHQVDLEQAFLKTMDEIENSLKRIPNIGHL